MYYLRLRRYNKHLKDRVWPHFRTTQLEFVSFGVWKYRQSYCFVFRVLRLNDLYGVFDSICETENMGTTLVGLGLMRLLTRGDLMTLVRLNRRLKIQLFNITSQLFCQNLHFIYKFCSLLGTCGITLMFSPFSSTSWSWSCAYWPLPMVVTLTTIACLKLPTTFMAPTPCFWSCASPAS